MHDARNVANEFICLGIESKKPFTHMQIQKLAYFAHAWTLTLYDRPLTNQRFEAWRYGPVSSAIYYSLSRFSGEPVGEIIPLNGDKQPFDLQEENVINQVFEKYGHLSGLQLSTLTHAPGTPWEKADSKRKDFISDDSIQRYYSKLKKEAERPG